MLSSHCKPFLLPLHATVLAAVIAVTPTASGLEFHVAPTGDDAAQGSAEAPFRSLERARDAIRAARKEAASSDPVTVVVHPGVYLLAKSFWLTKPDGGTAEAPVVYRSAEPGRAILRGSVPITGFKPVGGGVLTADVKPAGLGGKPFKLLFWNGRRMEMARYPNIDPANPFETGWAFTAAEPVPAEAIKRVGPKRIMRLAAADRRTWANPTSGEVSIFPSHEWWNNVLPITTVDQATGIVELKSNTSYDIVPGDRYFIRGLREDLDAAGEWHLDRKTGVVSLIPPEPLAADAAAQAADAAVWAPRTDTLVQIDPGVAHLELRGFVLEECAGTAVRFTKTEHCTIADCTIRACGDYAGDGVSVSGRGNAIVRCEISDIGSHGISLSGGDFKTLAPGNSRAEGNRISRTGVIHKQGCGVIVSGVGNRVAGNEIHDLPRFGVMFGGVNLVVEANRIERVSLETMDTAAIYGGSLDWRHGHGCVIRGNVVKDVIGRSGKAGVWKSPFFAWGIYLDWAATGMTVEGNTVVRCPRAGIMLHDGRDNTVVGNTIIDCGFGTFENGQTSQIEASGWNTLNPYWQREFGNWCRQYDELKDQPAWQAVKSFRDPRTVPLPDGQTMHGHVIERNILAWHAPSVRPFNFRGLSPDHNRCDHNLLWHFGEPITTGAFRVKSAVGGNLAGPNPGFEGGAAGNLPTTWIWSIRPSPADTAAVTTDDPRSGRQCLRIEGIPDAANSAKEEWARLPGVRGAEVAVEPGSVYRLVAWLRAAEAGTPMEIGFTAYKPKATHWTEMRRFMVGPEWSRHEVVARIPERQSPPINSVHLRFRLAREQGLMFVDDVEFQRVEPLDEWTAWQDEGWDRHSTIADPLFVAAEQDDYRLRDDSPARRLGLTSGQPGSTPPPAGPADRSPLP